MATTSAIPKWKYTIDNWTTWYATIKIIFTGEIVCHYALQSSFLRNGIHMSLNAFNVWYGLNEWAQEDEYTWIP